ncbi:hypothetical protein DPMN_025245 [Dreissena polymorpha]|uniref:Uncharacterized protein n=1 Tax=Dreissena polymorpha TaxID=45954 RepID=A0A9D4LR02_DREPO|nr:hypothetical protein DPMN_025245 [Dreissena polymorpha]
MKVQLALGSGMRVCEKSISDWLIENCGRSDRYFGDWSIGNGECIDSTASTTILTFAHLRGTNILVNNFDKECLRNVNARVFTNQMCTDGQRTKTNPKTSTEQSAIFQLIQEINKTNVLTKLHDGKLPPTLGSHIYKTNLFTKFHDDWANNVTSTAINHSLGHVIQLTGTIFQLNSRIKETNVLTKFHENWTKNVTSRVFTCFHHIHIEKNAPPTGGHVFSPIWTIFELVREINKTNVLTNFHDDWAKIVTSRVFTRKTAPPTGGHIFQRTFKLNQHIIKTNIFTNFELDRDFIGTKLLTKFHEDRTINVASRVFTNKSIRSQLQQKCMIAAGQYQNINIDCYESSGSGLAADRSTLKDRKINVAFRVLTRKNAMPSCSHVFQPTSIIFELVQDIIGMNLLTKFHEDRTVNVASRVLTRLYYSHIRKNTPPLGSHVFQANIIIFELIQDNIETNLLTKFHEDWTINEKCPAPGDHAFKATKTIFELIQDIIGSNLLTKFPDDHKINVASRVLTWKNAPPPGGHVFQPSGITELQIRLCITFELIQDIIGTNLLTKFHEDQTINVASREKSHVFQANVTIFKLIQDIIETNLLTKFHEDWK